MRREQLATSVRFAAPVALVLLACVSGAAASSSPRRCSPEGYGLEQHPVQRMSRRPNAVRLTAGWLANVERRRSCALHTTIRVTISGARGVKAGAHWSVKTALQPWGAVVHTWVWKNWCGHGQGEPSVTFSLPDGTQVGQDPARPPACVHPHAATTLADVGTGTTYVKRPGDRVPPHLIPPGTPPPLHWELINPVNAWIVSDGYTLVAVYAGSPGSHPSRGRFAIVRQNLIFGIQIEPPDLVDLPKAGALKITGYPQGAAQETTAQRGRLTFASAHGVKGVLDLRADRVRITSSG